MTLTIDTVGLVEDLSEADYHAHSALSSTGARTLLKSPARFQYERTHPVYRDAFDLGSALHTKVLNKGWPVDVHDFDNWTTKAAKEAKAASRAEGRVPMLRKDADVVDAMAEAVLRHPLAREVLDRAGIREASLFATDPDTGVEMRARFDHLQHPVGGFRLGVDLKSAHTADSDEFARDAAKYGYQIQQAFYQRVAQLVTGEPHVEFYFVVVEKAAPYLVNVIELDAEYVAIGQRQVTRALETYAECVATDRWPGYGSETTPNLVGPPAWLAYAEGMEF